MFDVWTDSLDDNLGLLDDCKWMFDVSTDSLDDNLGRLHSNKDALLGHLHSNSSAPWASALQQQRNPFFGWHWQYRVNKSATQRTCI
jgi:hypothetical protein